MALDLSADDLATFLGLEQVVTARAELMLTLAQQACSVHLAELPAAAASIVLTVAARAYANPQGVMAETIGPYSVTRPAAGIYLTRSERQSLQLLSGRGGAFTVDPTPVDAGSEIAVTRCPRW